MPEDVSGAGQSISVLKQDTEVTYCSFTVRYIHLIWSRQGPVAPNGNGKYQCLYGVYYSLWVEARKRRLRTTHGILNIR